MIVAIFVIVVMSLVAAALFAVLGSAAQQGGANVGGVRAKMAARSAAQNALIKLFPKTNIAADCSTTEILTFNATSGLENCSATVACTAFEITANVGNVNATYYRLVAEGSCEIGRETYTRQLLLEATDAND